MADLTRDELTAGRELIRDVKAYRVEYDEAARANDHERIRRAGHALDLARIHLKNRSDAWFEQLVEMASRAVDDETLRRAAHYFVAREQFLETKSDTDRRETLAQAKLFAVYAIGSLEPAVVEHPVVQAYRKQVLQADQDAVSRLLASAWPEDE